MDWFDDYVIPTLTGGMLLGFALMWLGVGIAVIRWACG